MLRAVRCVVSGHSHKVCACKHKEGNDMLVLFLLCDRCFELIHLEKEGV